MNFYAGAALAALIFTTTIGLFTWLKARDRALGRLFGLVSLSISLWVLGCLGESYASNRWALTFDIILYAGACFAPTLFLHFVLIFSEKISRFRSFLTLNYCVSSCFVLINLIVPIRHFFIDGVLRKFPYRYIAQPNFLWYVFSAWYGIPVCFLIYILFIGFKQASQAHKRHQYQYFLLAASLLAVGGTMYFGLVLSINMPMIDNFFTIGYGIIMAYAILNHRLMDLNLIIRKTLIYSVVTGVLTAIYLGIVAISARVFQGFAGSQTVYSSAIAAGLITVCFQPLRKRVQAFVDSKFFRQYVDREEKLYELSREVITHTTSEAMAKSLIRVLGDTLHPKSVALYLKSRDGNGFALVSEKGNDNLPERMPENNSLTNYFMDHPQPFVQQDLRVEAGESLDTRRPARKEEAA